MLLDIRMEESDPTILPGTMVTSTARFVAFRRQLALGLALNNFQKLELSAGLPPCRTYHRHVTIFRHWTADAANTDGAAKQYARLPDIIKRQQ